MVDKLVLVCVNVVDWKENVTVLCTQKLHSFLLFYLKMLILSLLSSVSKNKNLYIYIYSREINLLKRNKIVFHAFLAFFMDTDMKPASSFSYSYLTIIAKALYQQYDVALLFLKNFECQNMFYRSLAWYFLSLKCIVIYL